MKKKFMILLYVVIIVCFVGCSASPPSDMADELIANQWILYNGNKESGNLKFENGHIILNVDINNDEPFIMNEEYIIDNNNIIIVSDNYGAPKIEYNISGEKLELIYCEKHIILKKKNNR